VVLSIGFILLFVYKTHCKGASLLTYCYLRVYHLIFQKNWKALSTLAHIGTKDSVEKLKRRIFLERVSSIPGTKYVVSAYVKSKKNKEKNP
jgi:hypothetical protein